MVNTYWSMYVSLGEYTNEPNEVFMFEEDTSKLKCSNVQYQNENKIASRKHAIPIENRNVLKRFNQILETNISV